MISFVIQRQFFIDIMSQKRITSFFVKPDSLKRKFSDCQNKTSTTAKKVAKESIASKIVSYNLIKNEDESFDKTVPHTIDFIVGETWYQALEDEFKADYFKKLCDFLLREKEKFTIYPPIKDVFSWTTSVEITDVKIVILGQDPYIRPSQAHGLAFSVPKSCDIPKSLINIYKELTKDISGFVCPSHGCLNGWAKQGVLLLNTCLTVRAGKSDSHKNAGWELFTDAVIKWINENLKHVVFILWGNNAKVKAQFISKDKHLVLTSAHPSPLSASRGFFGCRHFSKANRFLQDHGREGIDWSYLP